MGVCKPIGYWGDLVAGVESCSPAEWRRLFASPNMVGIMNDYLTAKCVTDFWWHLRYGVYFKAWRHYDTALHGRVAAWLQDWRRERHGLVEPVSMKALIMSRELCKTQILIAWDGWKFAQDTNNRLLVRGYDQPKADEIGAAIGKLLRSKKYRERYPWVEPSSREGTSQAERWRPDKFMLERDDEDVKVPSMEAIGVKGQPIGGHFQMGHADDIEVDANANSEVEREVLFETHRNDANLFEAGSQRVLAGTPWSMLGLIYGTLYRKNGQEDHDIDVFKQACCNPIFDRDFSGHSPHLADDRRTLFQSAAGFPTALDNLETCQAKVTFFSTALGDTVEEIREVVWNDGDHFRVNRPFPEVLGQPVHYTVGREKPCCPVRQTLDSVDWIPEFGWELPAVVAKHGDEPGVDGKLNARFSLPGKLRAQGSRIYALQQELKGTDTSSLVLNSGDLQVIPWSAIPEGIRRWRRSSDFASAKKTAAATSMTTGFEIDGWGFCITHIAYEPRMGTSWKLLELLVGLKRVEGWDGRLEWTSFEKSGHIEEVIGEMLPDVCRDPHAYFERLGAKRPASGLPTYAEYADLYFTAGKAVSVPLKWLSRTQSKNDRMSKQQPVWESGKLFIVEDCPHIQTLRDMADRFTMLSEDPLDLLDNTADLLSAGRLLKTAAVAAPQAMGRDDYHGVLDRVSEGMAEAVGRGVNPGWMSG